MCEASPQPLAGCATHLDHSSLDYSQEKKVTCASELDKATLSRQYTFRSSKKAKGAVQGAPRKRFHSLDTYLSWASVYRASSDVFILLSGLGA